MADPTQPQQPQAPPAAPPAPTPNTLGGVELMPVDTYRTYLKGEATGTNSEDEQFALDTYRSRGLVPHLDPLKPNDPWFGMAESAHGVPHGVLPSIAHQESGGTFDPYTREAGGRGPGRGIMQFTDPRTMAYYGVTEANWTNPYLQIDRAGQLLADNYGRLKSWDQAITAYNHPPGRTDIGDPNYLAHVNQWYRGGPKYTNIVYEPVRTPGEPPQPGGTPPASASPPGAPGAQEEPFPSSPGSQPGGTEAGLVPWYRRPEATPAPGTPPGLVTAPGDYSTGSLIPSQTVPDLTTYTPTPTDLNLPPGATYPIARRLQHYGFDYPRSIGEVGRDIQGIANTIFNPLAPIAAKIGGFDLPESMQPGFGGRTIAPANLPNAALATAAESGALANGLSPDAAAEVGKWANRVAIAAPIVTAAAPWAVSTTRNLMRTPAQAARANEALTAGHEAATAAHTAEVERITTANKAAAVTHKQNMAHVETGLGHSLDQTAGDMRNNLSPIDYNTKINRQQHLQSIREGTDPVTARLGPNQREQLIGSLQEMDNPKLYTPSDLRQIVANGGRRVIGGAPDPAFVWRGPHEVIHADSLLQSRMHTLAEKELTAAENAAGSADKANRLVNARRYFREAGVPEPPSLQRDLTTVEHYHTDFKHRPPQQTPLPPKPVAPRTIKAGPLNLGTPIRKAAGAFGYPGLGYAGYRAAKHLIGGGGGK